MRTRAAFFAGLALCSGAALASPATDIFRQAVDALSANYQGTATILPELAAKHRILLDITCVEDSANCPTATGIAQVKQLAQELDWRVSVYPPAAPAAAPPAPQPSLGFDPWPHTNVPEILVTDLAANGAAHKAGLLPNDRIVAVNGRYLESQPSQDALYASYMGLVNSAGPDRPTRLTVIRGDLGAARELEISVNKSLNGEQGMPVLYKPAGALDGVLVLRIPSLIPGAAQRVHDLVHEAQAQGATALVLHILGTSGGSYRSINALAGAFLGNFQYTFRTDSYSFITGFRDSAGLGYKSNPKVEEVSNPALWTGRLAVFTNKYNLAGGEILPYLLQRNRQAVVIGEQPRSAYLNTGPDFFSLADGSLLLVPAFQVLNADGTPFPETVRPDATVSFDIVSFARDGLSPYLQHAYEVWGMMPSRPSISGRADGRSGTTPSAEP